MKKSGKQSLVLNKTTVTSFKTISSSHLNELKGGYSIHCETQNTCLISK